jgi:WS/DGAT/MGAT family acyltransferase
VKPIRLSAIETGYVALDRRRFPVHVGSIAIFEAAPLLDGHGRLRIERLRSRVGARLGLVPRLRQRVARVPFELGRPVWVDDPTFDIANHVDVVSLPPPGDEAVLLRLAAELHMRPFSPDRPMWQLCFVTGLPRGRVALVERVHHAMVDGVSGVDVATVLLDVDRNVSAPAPAVWTAAPPPSAGRLIGQAIGDQVTLPARLLSGATRALQHPGTLGGRVGDLAQAVGSANRHGIIARRSSLNRRVGTERTLSLVRRELAAVKAAGAPAGATANDVVLTAVAGGLRSLLLARGEPLPADLVLTILVPVSLRDAAERGTLGNRVGGLQLPLPVGIGDPDERLRTIATISTAMKARREVTTSELLLSAADLLPAPLVATVSALLVHQPFVNLVVTNVPGPPFPLYAMGAEMLEAFPIVPLAGNLTLGVAVLSYNGALNLEVTADATACPDVDAFVAGVEQSFGQLGVGASRPSRRVAG